MKFLSDSPDPDALKAAFQDVTHALDLSSFAYLRMPKRSSSKVQLITNYPSAWISHYLAQHYEQLDPVIQRAIRRTDPFAWGSEIGVPAQPAVVERFFEEAAVFGIRHGFTIPIHDRVGGHAAVTFATDVRSAIFRRSIAHNSRVLQLLSILLHRQASRAIGQSDSPQLTPREAECLAWAAKGKSAWETGRILGVSRRTVAFHLKNVRAKLGVYSTIEAVMAAFRPRQSDRVGPRAVAAIACDGT